MADNEFLGSAFAGTWIGYNSGGTAIGTTVLATDFRNFNYSPSIDIIDATAGADSNRRRITYLKDGQVTCTMVLQYDIGTVQMNNLAEGVSGTLVWGEGGTATGRPKHTMPAICLGASYATPYNDVVSISVTWQQNGTRVDTVF